MHDRHQDVRHWCRFWPRRVQAKPSRVSLFLVFISLLFGMQVAQAQDDPLNGLDAYVQQAMEDWQVPGVAIAVVKDDIVVFEKGYGVREVGQVAEVNEQTSFLLLSLSKTFTAAAVGLLVDEGKLSWDDPVVRHLPWFQLPDPWVTRQVTLRDLLAHHLAGELGNSSWIFDFTGLATEEKLRRLRFLEPVSPRFRSSTSYSNINYALAGAVIEAVSGMSWSDFFRSRLLEPVGMTSATPDVCEAYANRSIDSEWVENLVTPHAPGESGPHPISAAPWDCTPAGAVGANVHDVTAWLRLQLGEGSIDGVRVLSAEVVEEMHSVQAARPGWDLESVAFGLGWRVQTYRGHKIVVGAGGTSGQKHRIGLIPEQELGVVVLTNQRGHPYQSRLPDALIRFVFDAYLGEPRVDWSEQYLESASAQNDQLQTQFDVFQAQRVAGTAPSLPLSRYTGTYSHRAFGDVVISDEGDGSLKLTFQDGQSWTLEHWHYDVYRILLGLDPPPPFFLTFVIGPFGQVSELRLGGVEGVWQR